VLALIALFLLQVPPVAGRPADFSGAVGGPFVAAARVDRPSVAVGDPVELTLTVTGPGDLSGLRRPDLKRLSDFASRFDVRDGLESHSPHPPSRRFTYWLRPRSADVSAVPRVKLVYYNPAVRAFQTTYSEPVPLRVAPREPARPAVPAEVTRWADRVDALAAPTLARVGWSRLDGIVPWLIPPAACLFGYAAWRFVRGRPTDAAAERALQRLRAPADDPARTVADTLCEFLRDRVGLPAGATSPADVSAFLYDHRLPPAAIDRVRSVLARCDEWRYADGRAQAQPLSPAELIADAASLIRRWEWPR
jgi:hypothetical protein